MLFRLRVIKQSPLYNASMNAATYMAAVRLQAASTLPWDLQVNGEDAYVVLNAGCRDKDIEHIQNQLKKFQVSSLISSRATLHIPPNSNAFCTAVCIVHTLYHT